MAQLTTQQNWRSPILMLFLAMASIHSGAAIAKSLFDQVSPFGMVSLRLGLGALVLVILFRPQWRHHSWQEYRLLALLGLSMGVMNACLYHAIAYIPIGAAVTLEFIGPLGVALAHSRRGADWLWVMLAATGVVLLAPVGGASLHPIGVLLALIAGSCWAAYILLSARVGKVFPGSEGVAMAMTAGAIAIVPFGIAAEGTNLLNPYVLMMGLLVAVLSSALPYSLEMSALRQLPVKVFGVLMSVEPAVASCIGLIILGEQLSFRMVVAMVLVSSASIGSTLHSRTAQ
ncbi:DMT family transporter [Halomicronema sp. CCY15110]|uniref:EamA family transporter n=1 Tax=Halomicronema sp. CCY15110 TaxID=2767773 RepID=UPI00281599F8|nr:DMT family transporter [Halomicronema sp. CCY15110]